MKSHIKTGYLFLYIALVSLFGISYIHDVQSMISYFIFFTAVATLYLIKNKYIACGLSVLLMSAYSVYKINYAIFMIPVYLLIIVYRSIIKKIIIADGKKARNGDVIHMGLHFLIILGLVGIIYAANRFFNNDYQAYYKEPDKLIVIAAALIMLFVLGIFSKKLEREVRQNYKVNTKNYITLNLVNFVAMFLFFSVVFLNYAAYQDLQVNYLILCFPWSVWLCVLVYEKNPITESIFNLIEEEIKKVSERRIKEK